ncbi:hypothetical protein H4R34_003359 [Dimargaris verticillata]|uniref:Elongation factor 1-beta n=1 Tax=Dimargaris verticillata TaxID=2761393 RepID=A0A9W8B721_9FUNG|nr:hypothetical protein H4R34_003359 [Dimargaris verticillata]
MAAITLKKDTLQTVLNGHLESVSYIAGATPSQQDTEVFAALTSAPDAAAFPHLARWYKHIAAQGDAIKSYAAPAAPTAAAEEDDDIDLFGSDDEDDDEEKLKLQAQRLAEYKARKAAKPAVIHKSMVIFDVKPWDDETDLKLMEESVRSIEMPGLLWSEKSELVPVGFGIKKLRISAVIEDDKVSTADLEEKITEFEDYVQSVDIQAFNKL